MSPCTTEKLEKLHEKYLYIHNQSKSIADFLQSDLA